MADKKKKTGAISNDERKFIIDNSGKMTSEELAEAIGKSVKIVEKEIQNHVKLPTAENNTIRWHLKKLPEWKSLKQQFSNDELNLIEEKYIKYVEQMESNLTATEESQVLNMIKIEILMDRNLIADKESLESISIYQQTSQAIIDSVNGNVSLLEEDQREKLQDCQNQITSIRDGHGFRNKQHMELQTQLNNIHSKLKTSRDQRVNNILDAKMSFGAYVKSLGEIKKQQKESRFIELNRLATEKESQRLSRAHKYADGSYDNPMLTAEILEKLDKEDEDDETQDS